MISNSLYSPLTHLCNLSITRVFSSRIQAGECHTSKSDDPCVFDHYHPVSLLSALSKGLWESSHVWLSYKLHRYLYDILFQYQCGLRKMHPSRMPFMVLMDKLIKSVDIGNCVNRVYLDFSWDYYRGTRNSAAGPWIISPVLRAPARRCKQGAHYTYGKLWQH